MHSQSTPTFNSDWISPPGETVEDILEERDMSQAELARRLGISSKHVNQIIQHAAPISASIALGLEKVLGPPAAFWLRREGQYRADVARLEELQSLESAQEWAKQFPYLELAKLGYVNAQAKGGERGRELLKFFGIASPAAWQPVAASFRRTEKFECDEFALESWLQIGAIEAAGIDCEPFDKASFAAALIRLRDLTRRPATAWLEELVPACAACGVAVVVSDALPKTRTSGAARWLSPQKATIQLSLRYRWEDSFWFSFFHEAGHILLHGKKAVFVEGRGAGKNLDSNSIGQRMENEANQYAAETLVPPTFTSRLESLESKDLKSFAKEVGVSPAIIVGRMQHEGILRHDQWNDFRARLQLSSS